MKKKLPKTGATNHSSSVEASSVFFELRNLWWKAALLLAVVGTLIYANSLRCDFQFDDGSSIVENPRIQNLSDLPTIWSFHPPRFLTHLSFAINYRFSGVSVTGYHVTNILIHIVSSFWVFLLVWISTRTPLIRQKIPSKDAWGISLFSSLIFLCHPVQTQAVTYIVQRAASLATLFYLGTMLCYVMARLTQDLRWYVASCLSCIASMFTKETAFTLPFMILLYDFTFFDARARLGNQRLLWFLPFLATLSIIPFLTIHAQAASLSPGLTPGVVGSVSPSHYLLTQFHVIRTYLRLLFFPANQSLAYDYPIATHFFEMRTFFSFALLAGIFAFGIWIFRRQRLIAFGIFWFFLALSVESSVIPILDVIFEHRLYLPMVGFAIAITVGAYMLFRQKSTFKMVAVIAVVILSVLTIARNRVWETKLSLWQDAVKQAPELGSAHYSLGLAFAELGRNGEALREYQRALDLGFKQGRVYNSFARIFEAAHETDAAIQFYEMGVAADPTFAPAFSNLGALLAQKKHYDRALLMTQKAISLGLQKAETFGNLGAIYASLGKFDKATGALHQALRVDPEFAQAKENLLRIHQALQEKQTQASKTT